MIMPESVEYDAFAGIYDIWVEGAPVTKRNLPFYVEEYLRSPEPVVELGVGNDRIAIEAARQGKPIIGVDSSAEMLKLCREQAEAAGVAHLLTLIQADFRDFVLPEPAHLIAIPFHTIGHLVTLDDKRAGLRHIYGQLAPGGHLVFDHFVFDPEAARRHQGVGLHGEYTDAASGHDLLLWTTTLYDFEAQTIRIIAWTDELDDDGVVLRRQYRRLSFSWLDPQQTRTLLEETGFEVEALYGDFDRRPFGADSPEQVWVARRPRE
jgi:SAM-dependent methyltransferase